MRTLELRLADDVYYGPDIPTGPGRVVREEWNECDRVRAQTALEFFDRALVAGMAALSDREEVLPARVFSAAAELTLLRFGVRIVGLKVEERPPSNPAPWEALVREALEK